MTYLLWLLTKHKATRSAAWCSDPAPCPTMGFWEGIVALKICSMLNSHQEEVSQITVWHLYKYAYAVGRLVYIVCVISERRVPLRLNYSKYGGLLTDDNLIRLAALLLDYSTNEAALAVRNIVLDNPEIKVRVSAITCNKTSTVDFKNKIAVCEIQSGHHFVCHYYERTSWSLRVGKDYTYKVPS